ncbi:MAG TPA: multicopper oxidase family protein [Kribbella sp.]|nr:multicopper oxidase family protein [Kribbella sp.]
MTTGQAILLDHLVAVLCVAAWFATGAVVALRRVRLGLGFLVTAVVVTLTRVATVAILARAGWWFVEEKVLLGLPMLATAGLAAVLIAGRPLLKAQRTPGIVLPPSSVVAPLTAAYAALAGLVVTFLAGYPLTWSTALITASILCGVVLLTSRVVAASTDDATGHSAGSGDPAPAPDERPGISRRQLMRAAGGVAVAGAGVTSVGMSFLPAESTTTGGGPAQRAGPHPHMSVADLRGALRPAAGGATRRHVLIAQSATVRLPSGRELDAWTYSGQVPGPAITATEGDLIEVTLRNADIEDGVTLHWHGYDVACGEDGAPGVTQHVVAPGEEFVYHFRADQVGTYWYHTHQTSHIGVRRGLYGTLVVHPRQPQAQGLDLTLPVHSFDDVVLIGDRDGRIENTTAPGTPVRLRLINTDSAPHRLALVGTPFRVAALDGRDLNEPGEIADVGLRLAAGGRYDLVFDMPADPVVLVLDGASGNGVLLRPDDATGEPDTPDTSGWPELDLLSYGAPSTLPFDPDAADRHFTLVLDRGLALVDGRPMYAQTVNGLAHPSIPDQLVAEGDVVRFTVVNRSLETHPWHLHGHPVLALSRDGTPSSGSPLWVDTFDVRPGEVWEVAFEATNPGVWMNHCHNLPHAHQGMMLRVSYEGVTTPFGDAHTAHE